MLQLQGHPDLLLCCTSPHSDASNSATLQIGRMLTNFSKKWFFSHPAFFLAWQQPKSLMNIQLWPDEILHKREAVMFLLCRVWQYCFQEFQKSGQKIWSLKQRSELSSKGQKLAGTVWNGKSVYHLISHWGFWQRLTFDVLKSSYIPATWQIQDFQILQATQALKWNFRQLPTMLKAQNLQFYQICISKGVDTQEQSNGLG